MLVKNAWDERLNQRFSLGFYHTLLPSGHGMGYPVNDNGQQDNAETSFKTAAHLNAVDGQKHFQAQTPGANH